MGGILIIFIIFIKTYIFVIRYIVPCFGFQSFTMGTKLIVWKSSSVNMNIYSYATVLHTSKGLCHGMNIFSNFVCKIKDIETERDWSVLIPNRLFGQLSPSRKCCL